VVRLLVASMKHPNKLTWRRRRGSGWPSRPVLEGPFGLVEVRRMDGWVVLRNGAPLYHDTCRTGRRGVGRLASTFLSSTAARAAAELHLWSGWGNYERTRLHAVRLG
jgi:hypothetical protein